MAADATPRDRVYQTRQQVVIGWVGALATTGTGIGVLLLPTDHRQGGYLIATAAFLVALVMVRFALCGVRVTARGVRVTNLLRTTDLVWEQIAEFKLSPVGACLIRLTNGDWVSIVGIEQTNFAWLTKRRNTQAKRMIDELDALLREHTRERAATATTVP